MNDETKKIDPTSEQEPSSSVRAVVKSEKLFLLVEGQKSGPYGKDEIAAMVESNEVLVTDSVSVDGLEWFNLHQWSAFDRRSVNREELPGMPQVNLFVESDEEVSSSLKNVNDVHIEKEVIAGLAYIGNMNSGKKAQHHSDKFASIETHSEPVASLPEMEFLKIENKKPKKETYIWGAALSFALIGILYLFMAPDSSKKVAKAKTINKRSVASNKKASPAKRTAAKHAKKKVARKVVKARKRTPSFAKSKAFKNRAPRRTPARKIQKPVVEDPDDYYYDDGTDPVELDPIRSKLAKETFDPEDDEGLDGLQDEYNAEREPASAEEMEEDPEKAFEALYE